MKNKRGLMLAILFLLGGCAMRSDKEIYLVIGAMEQEVGALVSLMEKPEESDLAGIKYFKGTLSGKSVVVAQSGIGKVNAAYTTTMLVSHFEPKEIINIGSAGGTQVGQSVGDIVVATRLQYHDLDIGANTKSDPRFIFDIDGSLVEGIETVLKDLNMPYHLGLIVSGDQFVTKESSSFQNIQAHFSEAIAVEMEATAVAAIAQKTETPIIVLRALSDVTHNEGNDMDFETYLELASTNSAKICEAYLASK